MTLQLGKLIIEYKNRGLFLRLPWLGEGYVGNGLTCWQSWR